MIYISHKLDEWVNGRGWKHNLEFRVPKSLGWRGFKIIFFYDLFMIWIRFPFMIFLWVQIVVMIFLWFGYVFFMVLDMIFLWFFMVFLVLRIWFSAKNSRNFRFYYDFARVSFSPKPFQQKIWFWKQNRKKIVNASKVPRIWFSAKNSRNFRFFYDFARVSFSPKPFQQKIWFWKQNRKKIVKKIVNAPKVPRIWFSAKNSRNFRFFCDFARVSL